MVTDHTQSLNGLGCVINQIRSCDLGIPHQASEAYQREVQELRDLYEAILAHAQTEHPIAASTGKRGRVKQSAATNLIRKRLVNPY